jgi:peroxiredoxin family protein
MSERLVLFLRDASYEAAYQAASVGITATAMGEEVYVVFAFDALRQLLAGTFGRPQNEKETAESARAERLGLPQPHRMLEEARSLGAKLVVCDTTLKICGVSPSEVGSALDEVMGLPSIWRLTQGARVISL